jgi:hypothetical protein
VLAALAGCQAGCWPVCAEGMAAWCTGNILTLQDGACPQVRCTVSEVAYCCIHQKPLHWGAFDQSTALKHCAGCLTMWFCLLDSTTGVCLTFTTLTVTAHDVPSMHSYTCMQSVLL